MKRELVRKLNDEFIKIDKYLDMFRNRYGTVYYDGSEYIVCEPEEAVTNDYGEKIYSGGAYCSDAIDCVEQFDEAEDIDQVDINVDLFHYERTDEKVFLLDSVGMLKWKGAYFGI